MSTYIKSPFKPSPQLAVAGTPSYLFGSYNDKTGPTLGYIQSNSGSTTTGTLVFRIASGNVPIVGALLTAVGQANSANFNVTNAPILTVVCTDAGICTVTVTITSTTQASTADGGQVVIQQPEVGDTIASGTATASVPVAVPFNNPEMQEGKSITATLTLPNTGSLSGVVAVLQASNLDLDGEYVTIHTFAAVTAANTSETWQSGADLKAPSATPGNVSANLGGVNIINWRFYRFNLTSVTGTGPAIGKIEI
jgi:hypothetical protein